MNDRASEMTIKEFLTASHIPIPDETVEISTASVPHNSHRKGMSHNRTLAIRCKPKIVRHSIEGLRKGMVTVKSRPTELYIDRHAFYRRVEGVLWDRLGTYCC